MIPYGRQTIDHSDIAAVDAVLASDWLTTGPNVDAFEKALAITGGVRHAVAVSSGTAALHAAMAAIGIGLGDEVIVPAITFAASSNCVLYQKGTPVFADVQEGTLLIDPADAERRITPKPKAIIAVDYAGQPCDYDALRLLADHHHLALISDACHSIGSSYKGRPAGSLADMTCFSFHPVKHITTGEGGAILTDDEEYAARLRRFRNHGINTTARQREENGAWYYEMTELGFNYRITDFQCALGTSQLKKLDAWIARRNQLALQYDEAFVTMNIRPLSRASYPSLHAYHLYVVCIQNRDERFRRLRADGIGVNVHYIPVYHHPYYKGLFGDLSSQYPVAEKVFSEIISLPMFPALTDEQQKTVIDTISCKAT